MKAQKITIRLLKNGKTPQDVLKNKTAQPVPSEKLPDNAELYVYRFHNPDPDWAKYLGVKGTTQSARAVLFIRVNLPQNQIGTHCFALCFAGGHHMLNLDECVADFGIKTGLNILRPDGIKSSDVFTPSERSKQRRIQTTINANLQEHDFDGWLNILKSATGKVREQYKKPIAKKLSFSYDALTFHTDKPATDLPALLQQLPPIYESNEYKTRFPEVNYIKPIRDKILIKTLYAQLLTDFQKQSADISLNIPDLIDFADVSAYGYDINPKPRGQARESYESAAICDIYREVRGAENAVSADFLHKKHLILYDDDGKEKEKYPLHKCLVYDCSYKNMPYHFSHGQWYSLDKDFAAELSEKMGKAVGCPPAPFNLISYCDDTHNCGNKNINEAAYNHKLAEANSAILLDKQNIPMGGHDKIEPCDVLYTVSGDTLYFIHVKSKNGGSSGMAHLFAQGDNSLTLLRNKDPRFLQGLAKKIGKTVEELTVLIDSSKICIVYLIIAEKDKNNPRLPLFTQISLARSIDSLRSKNAKILWQFVKHFENEESAKDTIAAPPPPPYFAPPPSPPPAFLTKHTPQ